jgi:nudix-type nucleoside diphosphatase (YffH/AdpP family)
MKNPIITIQKSEILSDSWYVLNKVTFDYQMMDLQEPKTQVREVYERGNGAVILLYNTTKKSIILTRQFRLPTYLNGNASGMLIEACAGMLDEDNPVECIIRETEE